MRLEKPEVGADTSFRSIEPGPEEACERGTAAFAPPPFRRSGSPRCDDPRLEKTNASTTLQVHAAPLDVTEIAVGCLHVGCLQLAACS